MIELTAETLPDVHEILVRKSDWSIQLITKDMEKYSGEQFFNLSQVGKDDRFLAKNKEGVVMLVNFLGIILKKMFRLVKEDKKYLVFSRRS